jgi:hypothetical protein
MHITEGFQHLPVSFSHIGRPEKGAVQPDLDLACSA